MERRESLNEARRFEYRRRWRRKHARNGIPGHVANVRATGHTTASVFEAFAKATRNPGEWVGIYGRPASTGWLRGYVIDLAGRLGFYYEVTHQRPPGQSPPPHDCGAIYIRFELADARKQR